VFRKRLGSVYSVKTIKTKKVTNGLAIQTTDYMDTSAPLSTRRICKITPAEALPTFRECGSLDCKEISWLYHESKKQ
jgi:hypothetical protein